MSIVDKKTEIFGNIAAIKTLNGGLPDLKKRISFQSINNLGDPIVFLTDLIKALIGFTPLIQIVVDIITNTLKDIEKEVKVVLKLELKGIVSCGVNPSIPDFLKSTGSGVIIEVNKVDFFDMLLIDPNSIGGKLMYNDVTPTFVDSNDFNTFLYGVIQDDGVRHTWKNIFNVTFNSLTNGLPNNTLTINATSNYTNKKLTDLNNDFINSITLFNTENILNKIIDTIFGSISVEVGKTTKQLEREEEINTVIENIIKLDDDEGPDTIFEFTNDEIYNNQERVDFRKKGILKLNCCGKIPSSIPIEMLTDFSNDMSGTTTQQEENQVISNNLNKMANQSAVNSENNSDDITIKFNFIQNIIDSLIKSIVGMIISPKVINIFILNFKIMFGPDATFDGPVDFIKQNKALFIAIAKKVALIIIKKLIVAALKIITPIVAVYVLKKRTERIKNQKVQQSSLVGVPPDVLREIKGL